MQIVYYDPKPQMKTLELVEKPLGSIDQPGINASTLEDTLALEIPGKNGGSEVSKKLSEKSQRRHELFNANKEKSTFELIQLLQHQEPTTLYEAAKKAVERWRKSAQIRYSNIYSIE